MMHWLVWITPLTAVVFLWTLNEFLQGRLKRITSGVLSIFVFLLVGIATLSSGWQAGLAALIGAFVLGNVFRAPALFIARRLIKYPDLGAATYGEAQYQELLKDFGSDKYFERSGKKRQAEEQHMERAIIKALQQSDIRQVLRKHAATDRDMRALFQRIEIISLPPHMREEALGNPGLLAYFLENSEASDVGDNYVRNVTGEDVHLKLSLWAAHNPSGPTPE